MDYGRTELTDRLAAEYVAGTLRGAARRRFESLLPAHPLLREATRAWQDRLIPLTMVIAPVQPSGEVWRRISDRIEGERNEAKAARSAWQRLAFWRALTAFASVAAIGLAVLLANPRAVPPPVVVVLAATGAAPGALPAGSIVASISGDGATLVTRPLRETKTISSGIYVFFIHMLTGCSLGNVNSMPWFRGIERRYISPTSRSRSVRATSISTRCAPVAVMNSRNSAATAAPRPIVRATRRMTSRAAHE